MFTVFTDMNINDFEHVVMLVDIVRSWRSHIITAAMLELCPAENHVKGTRLLPEQFNCLRSALQSLAYLFEMMLWSYRITTWLPDRSRSVANVLVPYRYLVTVLTFVLTNVHAHIT